MKRLLKNLRCLHRKLITRLLKNLKCVLMDIIKRILKISKCLLMNIIKCLMIKRIKRILTMPEGLLMMSKCFPMLAKSLFKINKSLNIVSSMQFLLDRVLKAFSLASFKNPYRKKAFKI
jgi:hypothetical protein